MTPEMLWFQSYGHEAPQRCVMLGDADVVFAFAGVIYAMRTEEWLHFEGMVKAALEGFVVAPGFDDEPEHVRIQADAEDARCREENRLVQEYRDDMRASLAAG